VNARNRVARLRERLVADGADGALISLPSNLRYLTGFEGVIDDGINAAALVTADVTRFYTDSRYIGAVRSAAAGTGWESAVQQADLYAKVSADMNELGLGVVLMESEVSHRRFESVAGHFSGALRAVDAYVTAIRRTKEAEEIECIAAAATIADRAFERLLGFIEPGITEREIALELEFLMRRDGSNGMPFDPIVASGPQGARPHAIPGEREVEEGDLIVIDFGARARGYCSDMTRTIVVGKAGEREQEVYAAVLAANEAGLAAAVAGVLAADVHEAARAVLEERGLAEYFTHGLGHGVGLDVHELPVVSPRSVGSLQVGDVITIEPGVYIEGFGGVRIEDLAVVEEAGCRRLTNAPKELIEL